MFVEIQPRPNRSPRGKALFDIGRARARNGTRNSGMICEHYRKLVKPKEAERYRNLRPVTKGKVVPLVAHA